MASSSSSRTQLASLSSAPATALPAYVESLADASSKVNQALGGEPKSQQRDQVLDWLNRIDKDGEKITEDLKSLNAQLTSSTYLTANSQPTSADYSLLALLLPKVQSLSIQQQHEFPSLIRYISQLTFLFNQSIASSSSSSSTTSEGGDSFKVDLFEPDFEGQPKIVRTAVAAKKEKKATTTSAPTENSGEKSKKEKKGTAAGGAAGESKKKGGGGGGGNQPSSEPSLPDPSNIDLRVGKIVSISRHPDADSLYLEKVDFGETEGPRTILSGLVKYVPIEEMENRLVIGVCNLKPVAMRGIKSYGMLLCASAGEKDGGKDGGVEPVCPPEGSVVGDKVEVEGWEGRNPLEVLNPKKKIFEAIQPSYLTTDDRICAWKGPGPVGSSDESVRERKLKTVKGDLFSKRFAGATLS